VKRSKSFVQKSRPRAASTYAAGGNGGVFTCIVKKKVGSSQEKGREVITSKGVVSIKTLVLHSKEGGSDFGRRIGEEKTSMLDPWEREGKK